MSTALSTLNPALAARIASKRKEIKAKTNRVDIIKPQGGKHKYRILPNHASVSPEMGFWADLGRHYVKDTAEKMKAVYICTEQTFGRACAVCQEIERAGRVASDDAELKALEESRCKRADVLVNVLHLNSPDKATTPQVMSLTPTTFEAILGLMEEYGDITSLSDGIDLIIEREGTGLNTKYKVLPAAKSNPVSASVLDSMINLHEFVQQESETELRKAISAVNAIVGILDGESAAMAAPVGVTHKAAPAAIAHTPAPTMSDDDLSSLIEDAEFETMPMKATGTEDAAPFVPTSSTAPSAPAMDSTDIDALLADLG